MVIVKGRKPAVAGKLRSAKKAGAPGQTRAPKGRPPQSVSMTHQNASGAVSPVCRHVVAAVVGGRVGPVIGVSCSRRIRPIPVAMTVAMAGVTIAGEAVGAVGRSPPLDAAKIGLTAAIETTQSGSTIETRRTTGDVARRCARGATGRKASNRSGRRTSKARTTGAETRRRTAGPQAGRRTSEGRRRTRRRAELRECGTRHGGGAEHDAGGQGQQSYLEQSISPF